MKRKMMFAIFMVSLMLTMGFSALPGSADEIISSNNEIETLDDSDFDWLPKLTVHVHDSEGNPIDGALVNVWYTNSRGERTKISAGWGTTMDDGATPLMQIIPNSREAMFLVAFVDIGVTKNGYERYTYMSDHQYPLALASNTSTDEFITLEPRENEDKNAKSVSQQRFLQRFSMFEKLFRLPIFKLILGFQ